MFGDEETRRRGDEETALRLYKLSREISAEHIVNEDLRRHVTRIATGDISGLVLEDVIGDEFEQDIIPIVFSVDDNYVAYLATTLQSIIENASVGHSYLIIVLDCGMDYRSILSLEKQIKRYSHFRLRVISATSFISRHRVHFIEKDHFTTAIYGRFLIPTICRRFEKAIYADCDMVFNRDISELARLDLGTHYIAAVIDSKVELDRRADPWWTDYFEKKLGLRKTESYVNSGLIVFNIKQWEKLAISAQCVEKLKEKYIFPDQDVINIICKNKIYYLEQAWNCTCPTKSVLMDKPIADAINCSLFLEKLVHEYNDAYYGNETVFHYTSSVKPWSSPAMENGDKWWHYCQHTIHYEKILLSTISAVQNSRQRFIGQPAVQKFFFFGIPVAQRKMRGSCQRFWLLGVRWLKIIQQGDNRSVYFFWLKLMDKKNE